MRTLTVFTVSRYYCGDQRREDEVGRECGDKFLQGLVAEPDRKRPLGRLRCRWKIISKCILKK